MYQIPSRWDEPTPIPAALPTTQHANGWQAQANCPGYEDVYDRLADNGAMGPDLKLARTICAACPVASECLSAVLAAEKNKPERYGVFAGTTPQQRHRMDGAKSYVRSHDYSPEERARRAAKNRERRRAQRALLSRQAEPHAIEATA